MGPFRVHKPEGVCEICIQSEAKPLPVERPLYQAERPLLHVDLRGSFPSATRVTVGGMCSLFSTIILEWVL
jgi:hypothetical protein